MYQTLQLCCAPLAAINTTQYLPGVLCPVIFIVFKTSQTDSVIELLVVAYFIKVEARWPHGWCACPWIERSEYKP